MKMQVWMTCAVALALPAFACDVDDDAEQEGFADTDVEDEDDGETEGDIEDRSLNCFFLGPPSADVSTSLAGVVQSITRTGSGTGNGCDLFTVGVATPSGHRAQEVTFEGFYNTPVDAVARVWARSCTSGPFPVCTQWTSFATLLDIAGGCFEVDINSPPVCFGSVEGTVTLPANNSYTEVRAGARVETSAGTSRSVTITVSE